MELNRRGFMGLVTMKPENSIESLILDVRNQKVIVDSDLAALYGVSTKAFNQAVRRNADRFPEDFRWKLTSQEWEELSNRSQFVTGSQRHRDPRFLPYVFTEHGALQAANVLKSERAAAMSVFVIRAFIRMREQLASNAEILKRFAEIDRTLLEHNQALRTIWMNLQPLLTPPSDPAKPRIGFKP